VMDGVDSCPRVPNPNQEDANENGLGDACEPDLDNDEDGVLNGVDNCILIANPEQADFDLDGVGDSCDNCPGAQNPNQEDSDLDGLGDGCDRETTEIEPNNNRADCNPIGRDGTLVSGEVNGNHDWFCFQANAGERITFDVDARNGAHRPPNSTLDSYLLLNSAGGVLAENDDADGLDSFIGYTFPEAGTYYIEVASCCVGDGQAGGFYTLHVEGDSDGDGVRGAADNCPSVANPGQENQDGDAYGDACDPDPLN